MGGARTPPALPDVLMMPNSVAEYLPPRSVQVPHTVGWLQSVKNLTANREIPAATALSWRMVTSISRQATNLPVNPDDAPAPTPASTPADRPGRCNSRPRCRPTAPPQRGRLTSRPAWIISRPLALRK